MRMPETGWVYFGRRYYNPVTGRWTTSDPLGFTDGPNLYAYVHNNPLTHFDLYGLFAEPVSASCGTASAVHREVRNATSRATGRHRELSHSGASSRKWNGSRHDESNFVSRAMNRFNALNAHAEMNAAVMIQKNAMCKNALLGRVYGYDIDLDQAFQNARDYETEQCFINEKIIETVFEVDTTDLYYKFECSALCAIKVAEGYGYVPGLKGGLVVKGLPGKPSIRPQRSARTPHKGGAYNINASKALRNKLSEMQKTGNQPCRIRILPDGRVRYFFLEIPSATPGSTRGRSYVIEVDFSTGRMRAWMECYNHKGKVNRVHPKQQNGQEVISPHFPPTAKELSLYE